MEVLGLHVKPKINRAHHALWTRPGDNKAPWLLILRVHHDHALEEILRKVAATRQLMFQGERIHIFWDLYPKWSGKEPSSPRLDSLLYISINICTVYTNILYIPTFFFLFISFSSFHGVCCVYYLLLFFFYFKRKLLRSCWTVFRVWLTQSVKHLYRIIQ